MDEQLAAAAYMHYAVSGHGPVENMGEPIIRKGGGLTNAVVALTMLILSYI